MAKMRTLGAMNHTLTRDQVRQKLGKEQLQPTCYCRRYQSEKQAEKKGMCMVWNGGKKVKGKRGANACRCLGLLLKVIDK
jgi:hypothetical protein